MNTAIDTYPPFSKPKHTSPQLLKSWIFPSYLGSCYQATAFIYTLQQKTRLGTRKWVLLYIIDFIWSTWGCNTGRHLIVRHQLIWILKLHFCHTFYIFCYQPQGKSVTFVTSVRFGQNMWHNVVTMFKPHDAQNVKYQFLKLTANT